MKRLFAGLAAILAIAAVGPAHSQSGLASGTTGWQFLQLCESAAWQCDEDIWDVDEYLFWVEEEEYCLPDKLDIAYTRREVVAYFRARSASLNQPYGRLLEDAMVDIYFCF